MPWRSGRTLSSHLQACVHPARTSQHPSPHAPAPRLSPGPPPAAPAPPPGPPPQTGV